MPHVVYKNVGETPLECIRRLFDTATNTYAYAGRLDPMAEGMLLVLENEECKRATQYYSLQKTYEYSFVVGVETDTYDCLGRILHTSFPESPVDSLVRDAICSLTQTQTFSYPPYCSKTVNGVPLFTYARLGTLNTVNIPTATVEIQRHILTGSVTTDMSTIATNAMTAVRKVQGDFRQCAILRDWRRIASQQPVYHYSAVLTASSGTYVRSIVRSIGRTIGYPTVTTHIKRVGIDGVPTSFF